MASSLWAHARASRLLLIAASAEAATAAANSTDGAVPEELGFPTSIPQQSISLAKEGFRLDPTATESITVMGFAENASGDKESARRLLQLAAKMTRRDAQANLWLGTDLLQSGDIAAGLGYYDIILRTNAEAAKLILQRMTASLANPMIVEVYRPLLSRHPQWEGAFWEQALRTPKVAANASRLRMLAGLGEGEEAAELNAALLQLVVEQGEFDQAAAFYRALSGHGAVSGSFRDTLRQGNDFPPFDWQLVSEGAYGAAVVPGQGKLLISAVNGERGVVARRLLVSQPGRFRLRLEGAAASSDQSRLAALTRCASRGAATAHDLAKDGRDLVAEWDLAGQACGWYWLELQITVPQDSNPVDIEVDGVTLEKM